MLSLGELWLSFLFNLPKMKLNITPGQRNCISQYIPDAEIIDNIGDNILIIKSSGKYSALLSEFANNCDVHQFHSLEMIFPHYIPLSYVRTGWPLTSFGE